MTHKTGQLASHVDKLLNSRCVDPRETINIKYGTMEKLYNMAAE